MISASPASPADSAVADAETSTPPELAAVPPPLTLADLVTLEQEYAEAPPNNDVRRLLAEVRRLQARLAAEERPTD